VIILLIDAVIKLKRVLKFTPMTIALFVLTIGLTAASFFFNFSFGIGSFKFSLSIILILLGMVIGIIATALNKGGQKE